VLDNLATRYHLLPSQVLSQADTLDFLVMDVVLAYDRYRSDQEEAKRTGRAPTAPNLPINTLQEMMNKVRG
jgi:hypothetical protein